MMDWRDPDTFLDADGIPERLRQLQIQILLSEGKQRGDLLEIMKRVTVIVGDLETLGLKEHAVAASFFLCKLYSVMSVTEQAEIASIET